MRKALQIMRLRGAEGDMTSNIIILQETEKGERQRRLILQDCYGGLVEFGK